MAGTEIEGRRLNELDFAPDATDVEVYGELGGFPVRVKAGAVGGLATLDDDGKMPAGQIPGGAATLRGDLADEGLGAALVAFLSDETVADRLNAIASASGAEKVGFTQLGAVTSRLLRSKLSDLYSAFDFGAVGDGVADDTTALQFAINSISTQGVAGTGGTIYLPPGDYRISSTLVISKPIKIRGAGFGDATTNPNGSGLSTTRLIAAPGFSGPLVRVIGTVAGQYLFGGEVSGLELNGSGLASKGLYASSIGNWVIDLRTRDFTVAGVHIDDANGAYSIGNRIWNKYTGGAAAAADSHGLWLENNTSPGGGPQNIVYSNTGFVKNGDATRLQGFVDNILIYHCGGYVNAGTGKILAFRNNAAGTNGPGNNYVFYCSGGAIKSESKASGNRILMMSSEGTSITVDAGSQLHYEIVDYTRAGLWRTNAYLMSDRLDLRPGDFYLSAGTPTYGKMATGVGGWRMPDDTGHYIASNQVVPVTWRNGKVKSVTILFAMDAANTGTKAVTWSVGVGSQAPGAAMVASNQVTSSVNLTSNTARVLQSVTLTLPTPLTVSEGNLLVLYVARIGGDVGDTATGDAYVVGVSLNYESSGPTSPGSGANNIPPMGT